MSFRHRLTVAAVVFIRTADQARIVPNQKLASDTIRNASIGSRDRFAEITVQVPLRADLGAAVDALHDEVAAEREARVLVTALEANATVLARVRARRRLRGLGLRA